MERSGVSACGKVADSGRYGRRDVAACGGEWRRGGLSCAYSGMVGVVGVGGSCSVGET